MLADFLAYQGGGNPPPARVRSIHSNEWSVCDQFLDIALTISIEMLKMKYIQNTLYIYFNNFLFGAGFEGVF